MNPLKNIDSYAIYITFILILGALLRFYGLTNQSLWVDELHTMNEADPGIPWGLMFDYLKCCDQHPPLYFIIQRFSFIVFDHTEMVARSFSALCGLVSVWGTYLLGKELLDKKLGVIAALLMSINYFNIDYSQEARGYILVLLFTIFSYLYFIKTIKSLRLKDSLLYAIFSVLMLYTHYYSLFVVTSQAIVVLILLLTEIKKRRQIFRVFGIGGVLIMLGYLPWLPFMIEMAGIHSFWITSVPHDFFITYFFEYFGNNNLLKPFLVFLIGYFIWQFISKGNKSIEGLRESPVSLTFLVFFCCIIITYLFPYIRSITVVPMLLSRYTIVVLPAFIMMIAFSFILIKPRLIQTILLVAFVALSLADVMYYKRYYSKRPRKTQFREMTKYISSDPQFIYPIVEDRAAWQHAYYLKIFNYAAPVLSGNKEATIDSILNKANARYTIDGFWVVGAHADEPHLKREVRAKLDTTFTLVKEAEFYDTWAQLYVRKSLSGKTID